VFGLAPGQRELPAAERRDASKYFFEAWPMAEGVDLNAITAIVQSESGYLWLGTYNGLVRFDGVRFTVFGPGNTRGLRNGRVTSLFEDEQGALWIGHETGELTQLRNGEFHSVAIEFPWPGGPIQAIGTDPNRDLWLASDRGGFFRLRDGHCSLLHVPQKGWPGWIARNRSRQLWVVSNGTMGTIQDGIFTAFESGETNALPVNYEQVLPTDDGGVWVLRDGRLGKWRNGTWPVALRAAPWTNDHANDLLETRTGSLIVGTSRNGLYLFNPGEAPLHFTRAEGLPSDQVRCLAQDHEGNIWIGTGDGLCALRTRKVEMLNAPDGWGGHKILSFITRPDGSAWIGTQGRGLYRYRPILGTSNNPTVSPLSAPGGESGTGVSPVRTEAPRRDARATTASPPGQDTLVQGFKARSPALANSHLNPLPLGRGVGESLGAANQVEPGLWTYLGEANGLPNASIWSILRTRGNELLVGTWGGGLLVEKAGRFETYGEFSKTSAPILALYEGSRGELWIGTGSGLHRYEAGRPVWFAGKPELAVPDVRAITESPNGTLWFGMSGGGLGRLQNGALTQFRKPDGLASDFVQCLYWDAGGSLWIGTADHGLSRWRNGEFAGIGLEQGLPSSAISQIVDDGAGYLWFGSQRGILRASKDELNRCADGATRTIHCLSYGRSEGLTSQSCPGGFQPGAAKAADGRLWFPTTKGIAIVDPASGTTNPAQPPVVIEEFMVDGKPVNYRQPITPTGATEDFVVQIPPGAHRFDLRYTGLSFAAPDRVRFKHRLEGLEPEWSEVGTERAVQYSYLRPGSYRFQVTACNNDDVWNETGASLAFVVLPQVWQTWWFQAASLLTGAGIVIAGVLSGFRRRVRRKLEALERQRTLEKERTRIARDIHDDLGASLTRITMLSQTIRHEFASDSPGALAAAQVNATARELTRAMDEIVWAVNPKHDTLDSLATYLGGFALDFLEASGIRCRLDVPMQLPALELSAEIRHNVFLALKEALHNVLKHAGATEVGISLKLLPEGFELVIADNGCGFNPTPLAEPVQLPRPGGGNGLTNMRRRFEELGGRCEWDTSPGHGTRVRLVISVKR